MHVLRASPIEITKKYTPQNWFLKFNLIINNIIISVATGVDVLVVYEMFFWVISPISRFTIRL